MLKRMLKNNTWSNTHRQCFWFCLFFYQFSNRNNILRMLLPLCQIECARIVTVLSMANHINSSNWYFEFCPSDKLINFIWWRHIHKWRPWHCIQTNNDNPYTIYIQLSFFSFVEFRSEFVFNSLHTFGV